MLFTLRLLPFNKLWPQRVIYVAFALNLAITLLAVVSYGVKCVPFTAIYKEFPGAKCQPQNVSVITLQVNGALACIIDIATAIIPAFLLWKIQMKHRTKVILDLIFLLGLITAGMSIGRAAASNPGQEKTDFTWRNLPPCYFTMVEEKLGTTVACAPAIRQFVSYVRRTGTARPSKRRQPRNADFVKFRQRVKLRDIFWYRKPDLGGNDSQAQNLSRPEGVRSGDSPVTEEVKNSPLDWFHNKVKYAIDPRTRGRDVGKIDTSPTMSSKQDSERAMTRLSNERSTSGSHMGTDQQRPSASDVELGPVSESCRGHRPRENVGDEEIAINHEISVAQEAANNRANLLSTYPRTTDGTLGSGIQHHSRAHKLEPPPPAKRIG